MDRSNCFWSFLFIVLCTAKLSGEPPKPLWGFFGHKKINRMAVFTLPPDMIAFYKKNIEYITNHAVDPDKRRYAIKHEAMRHYIDLDQYGKTPFNTLPRNWVDALGKYSQLILINHKGDSIPFTSEDSYRVEKGKVLLFHPNIKKLFKVDTLTVGKQAYLQYVSQPIQNQFCEDEWVLSMNSLQKLFNPGKDV